METLQGVRPLAVPNLPRGRVTACLAAAPCSGALREAGVEALCPVPCAALVPEERTHADLLFCHAGENVLFAAPGQETLFARLKALGFSVRVSPPLTAAYPGNAALNVAVGENFALGCFAHAAPALMTYLTGSGRTLLRVRQGYAKCSLCFLNENAFLTEDAAIASVLRAAGKDVLLLSRGDVYLSDKHYGFFGGAAGLVAPDTLAVAGRLQYHRDAPAIAAFALNHGVHILELTDGKITDIGGILPLTEEIKA